MVRPARGVEVRAGLAAFVMGAAAIQHLIGQEERRLAQPTLGPGGMQQLGLPGHRIFSNSYVGTAKRLASYVLGTEGLSNEILGDSPAPGSSPSSVRETSSKLCLRSGVAVIISYLGARQPAATRSPAKAKPEAPCTDKGKALRCRGRGTATPGLFARRGTYPLIFLGLTPPATFHRRNTQALAIYIAAGQVRTSSYLRGSQDSRNTCSKSGEFFSDANFQERARAANSTSSNGGPFRKRRSDAR